MTVHTYNATLEGGNGLKYHATIFWEKENPKRLIANVALFEDDGTVCVPIVRWTAPYSVVSQAKLTAKILAWAAPCKVVSGGPTQHAPKLEDQNR